MCVCIHTYSHIYDLKIKTLLDNYLDCASDSSKIWCGFILQQYLTYKKVLTAPNVRERQIWM